MMTDINDAAALLRDHAAMLSPKQHRLLLRYLTCLQRWNQQHNLTALRDFSTMTTRHVLESLCLLPWLRHGLTVDVGSGCGAPAIALAIARPNQPFMLVEKSFRKAAFLRRIKTLLNLENIKIYQEDIRKFTVVEQSTQITTRGLASPLQSWSLIARLMDIHSRWLLLSTADALASLKDHVRCMHHHRLSVQHHRLSGTLWVLGKINYP